MIGNISQSRNKNKKKQKDIALSFSLKTQGRWDSAMHKQVANDESHSL